MQEPSSTVQPNAQDQHDADAFDPNRYVSVLDLGCIVDLKTGSHVQAKTLVQHTLDLPREKGQSPMECLFAGERAIRKVDSIAFSPHSEQIFKKDGVTYLNSWTPCEVEPVEGDCTPFLEHVGLLLDNDEEMVKFALNWMAHLVQRPEVKLATALLITSSNQGIGKGRLAHMLKSLVGHKNTSFLNTSGLRSDFNSWVLHTSLAIVEELEDTGRESILAKLKNYITDDQVLLNIKHGAMRNVPMYANFLLFSNSDTPLALHNNDRRFAVHRSEATPRESEYFEQLDEWFERQGGKQATLHFLLTRDLSGFNPKGRAPHSTSRQEMVENGRSPELTYLHSVWEAQETPFRCELLVLKDAEEYIDRVSPYKITQKTLCSFLKEIGAVPFGQFKLTLGSEGKTRVWAVRNQEAWAEDACVERVRQVYVKPYDQALELQRQRDQVPVTAVAQENLGTELRKLTSHPSRMFESKELAKLPRPNCHVENSSSRRVPKSCASALRTPSAQENQ